MELEKAIAEDVERMIKAKKIKYKLRREIGGGEYLLLEIDGLNQGKKSFMVPKDPMKPNGEVYCQNVFYYSESEIIQGLGNDDIKDYVIMMLMDRYEIVEVNK